MDSLSLSELKRLTRPFSSRADEEDAKRYWAERTPQERVQASERLMREFCVWRGIDLDRPMDKTLRRITLEQKNRDHEVWHSAFAQFLAER